MSYECKEQRAEGQGRVFREFGAETLAIPLEIARPSGNLHYFAQALEERPFKVPSLTGATYTSAKQERTWVDWGEERMLWFADWLEPLFRWYVKWVPKFIRHPLRVFVAPILILVGAILTPMPPVLPPGLPILVVGLFLRSEDKEILKQDIKWLFTKARQFIAWRKRRKQEKMARPVTA